MKHVVFLIDSLSVVGGTQRVSTTVAGQLARRGYTVTLLSQYGQGAAFPLPPGVEACTLGGAPVSLRSGYLGAVRALRCWLRLRRPDVLVLVESKLSNVAYPAALGLRLRRVAWEHHHFNENLGARSQMLARRVAAYGGHEVVTLTRRDAREWRSRLPLTWARIAPIANPLSFARPADNPYRTDSRTVFAAGRLTKQKGFDLLLSAWAQVEPQFPEWTLRILGSGEDDAALRQQAAELGLTRCVISGPTDDIEAEFRAAGLYALSSRHEGLPMVLMESLAYGVPAVAFDCPTGPGDLLAPGGGLLVPPGEIGAFARALQRLMADAPLRRQMSAEAFEHSRRYDADHIASEWVRLLEHGGRRAPR